MENDFGAGGGFEHPAGDFEVFVDDEGFAGAGFEGFEGVFDAVADFAAVEVDLVKVFIDKAFLLDELDVAEGFGCEVDGLVEAVFAAVGDVDHFDDFALEAVVEHVALVEVVFEVGAAGEDEAGDVDFVGCDVVLDGEFGDFADVVVAFFFSGRWLVYGDLIGESQ